MIDKYFNGQIRESNIIIIVHEHVTGGTAHTLRDFLLERSPKNLLFIAHPLLYIKETYKKSSYLEWYIRGRLKKRHTSYHWRLPEQFLYLKDLIYSFIWTVKTGTKYNLVLAFDPLNVLAGLTLKIIGRTERIVYYSIDYFPTRFTNPLMNKIYHTIDKIAVRFSDETWNVGSRMARARAETNGMSGTEYKKRQHPVPIGVWFRKIKRKPINSFNRNKLIFAGHFVPYMGIDLVIRALPLILKKVPGTTLDLIGRGEAGEDWKNLAKTLGVEKNVYFSDWMEDREAFHLRLSNAAIGLAPFNYKILDDKVRNADPGKIKDYTSSSLPVITTKAIYTWRDIEKFKCGIIVNYSETEFAEAVIKLMTNPEVLLQYRKNALKYAGQFDWEKLFTENLTRILNK